MLDLWIWLISAATVLAVIARPFGWPEWPWAIAGAALLVFSGLESFENARDAIGRGVDVYLFLLGMMALSELAREQGVFRWVAQIVARSSRGSASRLFLLVYGVGILVTVFLSNDATAVVLTPAVYEIVRRAKAKPKPYLFACALIANAASFVLPISNPANLVVYGKALPQLLEWLKLFALPSLMAITVTYAVLRVWFRTHLRLKLPREKVATEKLRLGGWLALGGLGLTVVVLLICSALKLDLGAPTFCAALLVILAIALREREWPREIAKNISWGVVPLVAGLFVLVEAVNQTVLKGVIANFFKGTSTLAGGFAVAIATNLANNLPVGLLAGMGVQGDGVPETVKRAVLIGVDLGPNLSVTGSLATILWLVAIRREGEKVSGLEFFILGLVVMPLSLLGSLLVLN